MQDLNNHPNRGLALPTNAQLYSLSARKNQLVQRDPYVCPLCVLIPGDIKPLIEGGNPIELSELLNKHIANDIKPFSRMSLPALDGKAVNVEAESIKLESSTVKLLKSGESPQPPSGIEYIDMNIDIDDISGDPYEAEYPDYEPQEALPIADLVEEDWDRVTDKFYRARKDLSEQAPILEVGNMIRLVCGYELRIRKVITIHVLIAIAYLAILIKQNTLMMSLKSRL